MGLFDDIPAPGGAGASPAGVTGKPRGLFDDLPASPEARAEPGGPLEITIRPPGVEERMRSFAPAPDAAEALRAAAPSAGASPRLDAAGPIGVGLGMVAPAIDGLRDATRSMMQDHINAEAAKAQGSSALVRDRKGEFVRKPIGEVEQYDFGPMIKGQDGGLYTFNPKTDVMLRDPASGKLMAFERDQQIDNPNWISKLWHAVAPGLATNAPSRVASSEAIPLAVERGRQLGFPVAPKAAQTGERMADVGAFKDLGVEPFAPAFRSKGAARFARTIEEMPLIGGIVKGPKIETENALAQAQQRIAQTLGAAPTDEQAGRVLQGGLDRFRTAGVQKIEPSVLEGMEQVRPSSSAVGPMPNIKARAPVQPGPMLSGGAAKEAASAAPVRQTLGGGVASTVRGTQVPAARPLNETIIARRGVEDLSDTELQKLIRTPAADTSFATRQEALYESAFRKIPALMKSDGSRNPNLVATPNSAAVASTLQRLEESARVKGGALEGRFGQLVRDLQNKSSNFTLESLKAAKTEVGRALASFGNYDTRMDRTQLKQLYAALSRDFEVGLQTVANRAYNRVGSNGKDAVSPNVAKAADAALYEMRRADRYTRVSMERMDRFTQLLNASSPEAAMRTLATRMKEGTIDRGLIRSVRDALRPEEREQILGYLVARMGQGRAGAKEAEAGWNIHAFATDWNRNKQALHLLMEDAPSSVRKQLDALAQISERMKYYETTRNYSGTAYSSVPIISMMSGAVTGGWGGVMTFLGQVGGGAALGKFLTNPRYLNWMVRAARTSETEMAKGPQVAGSRWPMLAAQLERLAANDNELGPVVLDALRVVDRKAVNAERDKPEDKGDRK